MSDHHVNHRYANEIIVPLIALSNNTEFIYKNNDLHIISQDNIKAKVVHWDEIHLCELEELTQRIYKMSAWDFALRWFNNGVKFYTAYFIYIKSEKIDV